MQCEQVRPVLSRFIDGELTNIQREEITRHLESCAGCRTETNRLDAIARLLKESPPPSEPANLTALVMQRAHSRRQPITLREWWSEASVPLRAAAVILLMIGLTLGGLLGRSASAPSSKQMVLPAASVNEPLAVYNLDMLGDLPNGSLGNAYLTLLSQESPDGGK